MIKSLTSLRGIFILFIFFHHCINIYPGGGSMAVTFFFILGGFSMTLGYKDKVLQPDYSYKNYLLRRCIKFYPLHWFCLIAVLPLNFPPFSFFKGMILLSNATLTHTLLPLKPLYFSFNAVSWYLADTLLFAVLFPYIIRHILKERGNCERVIIWVFVFVGYMALLFLLPVEWYHPVLYISPFIRLMDFVLGIILALCYLRLNNQTRVKSVINKNKTLFQLLIIFLMVILVVESCLLSDNSRLVAPVYWIPICSLILISSLLKENKGVGRIFDNRLFERLGELSFTIFLTHLVVLRYLALVFRCYQIEEPVIFATTSLLLTLMISFLVEQYILIPITKWLTKKILPSTIAQ